MMTLKEMADKADELREVDLWDLYRDARKQFAGTEAAKLLNHLRIARIELEDFYDGIQDLMRKDDNNDR